MGFFSPFSKTKDAAYYRALSASEFFTDSKYGGKNTSPYFSEEFRALPLAVRQEIVAGKFGITWAEYIKIPAAIRSEMTLAASGETNDKVVDRMGDAAAKDQRAARIGGFLAAFKLQTGLLVVASGVAGVAFLIYRKPIMAAIKKATK